MKDNMKQFNEALISKAYSRNKYKFFADIARQEGLEYFAKVFDEAAHNEEAHTKEIFLLLKQYGNTRENLKEAIASEITQYERTYPALQDEAIKNNDLAAARIFKQIGKIDKRHKENFEKLLKLLENDMVYKRDEPIVWKCGICGYIHEGVSPPEKCPACRNLKEFYIPSDIFY